MTNIRVSSDVSTETIRQQLGSFSLFSTVEAHADIEDSNVTVLHEVKLGERIKRFFSQSSKVRNQQVWQTQQALQSLARQRPEINTLLGHSIRQKQEWSASELRDALKIKASILKQAKDGSGLQVALDQHGQVGIANATVSHIAADSKITWQLSPGTSNGQFESTKPTGHGATEISVRRTADPREDELRSAYRTALENANGHVVIAPIDDVPHSERAKIVQQEGATKKTVAAYCCSDTSLKLLLEAIDEIKTANPEITAVTIACDDYPDKTIATRLVQQQAIRRAAADPTASAQFSTAGMERGRFQPKGNREAPGQAGMHFVKNPALSLHANRTIVPKSIVTAKSLDAIAENEAAKLPKLDNSRLIAFDDGFLDSPQHWSAQRMGERMSALLAGFTGKVVISPPRCDDDQLLAIVGAVNEACTNNHQLSVTFAVDDAEQRTSLTHAYANLRGNIARERDSDSDDDEQPVFADKFWNSV
jgi:hypothetical protein